MANYSNMAAEWEDSLTYNSFINDSSLLSSTQSEPIDGPVNPSIHTMEIDPENNHLPLGWQQHLEDVLRHLIEVDLMKCVGVPWVFAISSIFDETSTEYIVTTKRPSQCWPQSHKLRPIGNLTS